MARDAMSGISRSSKTVTAPVVQLKPSSHGAATKLAKVTEHLEEDAKEMEDRLIQLKISMLEEKKKRERELPLKHGGSRWRSAREDRGSVSKYAQDIQNRADAGTTKKSSKWKQTKLVGDSESANARTMEKKMKNGESRAVAEEAPMILTTATVLKWTTRQVLEWLTAIGFEEFQSCFEYHQITGATLLELTLDELTQIGVHKLSARNALVAQIDRIRDTNRAAQEHAASFQKQPVEIIDPKLRDMNPEVPSPNSRGGIHWSQVKPLSETTVAMGNGEVPVNLADGDFDEDASHASFMKALLDWRASDTQQLEAKTGGDDGLWVNPMMSFIQEDEEETETRGGALLEGSYDEAKSKKRSAGRWRRGATVDQRSRTFVVPRSQHEPSSKRSKAACRTSGKAAGNATAS
ncbi:Sterile alpha motif, type 1, partial [Globisporangium splendens]